MKKARVCGVEALEARTVLSASALVGELDAPLNAEVVHTPPQGTDKIVYQSTPSTYTLTVDDFGFSDPGNVPPNNFTAVIISAAPSGGFLTLSGVQVPTGLQIPVSQIMEGRLKYTLASTYSTFSFLVKDDGSTANGGMNTATFANIFGLVAETPTPNFVWNLYHDVLLREPEPRGIISWLDTLSGGATRQQVATMFWETAEHRGIQVDGYYQQFLHRNADPQGRTAWVNAMLGGATEEQIELAFMTTDEYLLNNPPPTAFVISIYNNLLHRAPDPGGQTFWINALNQGTMTVSQVAQNLINSQENHRNVVIAYYEEFLNRLPEPQGLDSWVTQLDNGTIDQADVAIGLLSSNEYFAKPRET